MSYSSSYMPVDGAISFEEYEKESDICISRSNIYVRFMLTFNDTPQRYKAIDVYQLNYLTVDSTEKYMSFREGKHSNEIEILIYLQHMTYPETNHKVKSLTYTIFDSVTGENVQKTFDLNYSFNTKPIHNFFNRFDNDSKFNTVAIETSISKFEFLIESNIEYDKILYQVDKRGRLGYAAKYISIVNEDTMDKSESYIYESNVNEYYWYVVVTIVGYQKDNVNYYTYPMSFSMMIF